MYGCRCPWRRRTPAGPAAPLAHRLTGTPVLRPRPTLRPRVLRRHGAPRACALGAPRTRCSSCCAPGSRPAYSEVLTDERKETAASFWQRANTLFAEHGITVERVLTDNGSCCRSRLFGQTLSATGIVHERTRPYRPQTSGKVERLNRTLLDEWAYVRPYSSNAERTEALTDFLHTYNHHRCHTALDGQPRISRVNNPAGHYN